MVRISPAFSRRIRRGGSRAAARVLDLLFPRSCISCEEPVDEESRFHFVCSPCSRRVTIVRSPACQTCGFPFFGRVESERKCPHCEGIEPLDRKSTRLNSSHVAISYAVFCLKK